MHYLAFIFFVTSFAAVADTPGDFVGRNKSGVEFRIVTDGASYSYAGDRVQLKPEYIEMYRLRTQGTHKIKFDQHKLPSNCVISVEGGSYEFLSCEKNSDTPLSGVRYEPDVKKFKQRGVLELKCVKGCTNVTPTAFVYESQSDFVP
jgi:hypothetical protein